MLDDGVLSALDAARRAYRCGPRTDTKDLDRLPVAAHGFAYTASATNSYAVDLKTGEVVRQEPWWWPALDRGSGHVFLAGRDGILRAYLLTQPLAARERPRSRDRTGDPTNPE